MLVGVFNMRKLIIVTIALIFITGTAYATRGDNGFECGISAGGEIIRYSEFLGSQGKQIFEYKEMVFITGEPLLFTGTVEVNRNQRGDTGTVSYNYSLTNGNNNKLTRRISLDSNMTKNNDQLVHNLVKNQRSKTNEKVTIDGKTYVLDDSSFQMSSITDLKAATDFFAGNIVYKKTYVTNDGTSITIEKTGKMYGFEHIWSNAEIYDYRINITSLTDGEKGYDYWGGYVDLKVSGYYSNNIYYVDNTPYEISFEGGYLQRQENSSILHYKATLPLFDGRGVSTDIMKTYDDEINVRSNPNQTRLNIPDLHSLRGHWYEQDLKELYSLNVFSIEDYDKNTFNPNAFITRAEFAKAVSSAAGIKSELEIENKSARRNRKNTPQIESPFKDIAVEDDNFKYIYALYNNNAMGGVGGNLFNPEGYITRAQAITIIIRMLGFENLIASPYAITVFKDNDEIPDWARDAFAASYNIGLIKGDDNNCVNPNKEMTVGEVSAFLNRFIKYLRHDLVKDYRENFLLY
jgi:hypothetical protein